MKKLLTLAAAMTVLPGAVWAHHGHSSQFDTSKPVEVSGTITDIGWVNPHAYVYFDVTDANGEVTNWHCEMRASSVLKRSGWTKDMFEVGNQISVAGVASRREANGCYVETVSIGEGPVIERYAQLEENKLEPETERPAVTPWGDPYIAGDWAAEQRLVGAVSGPNASDGPPGMGAPGRGRRGVELTEVGTEAQTLAAAARDSDAGRLDCNPRDFFSDWTFDQPSNAILQTQDKIVLKYGFMDTVRTIHMDMDKHPANMEPSWAGYSIGRWEEGVLVVDTRGFTEFAGARSIHSDQFHTVERFTLDTEKGSLTRSYEGEDSKFWKAKQTGEDVVFLSDYPWEPYACDDRSVE